MNERIHALATERQRHWERQSYDWASWRADRIVLITKELNGTAAEIDHRSTRREGLYAERRKAKAKRPG